MFALAALAYVPFKNIIDQMTPFEKVKLAISQEIFFDRLAQMSSPAEIATYTVDLERKCIKVKFADEKDNFQLTFDRTTASTSALYVSTSHIGVLNVLQRLQALFKGPIDHLVVDLKYVDDSILERLSNIPCETLTVTGNSRRIPKRRVAELLSKVHATKEVYMESDIGTRFFPSPPADKIVLKNATGTTQADLLALGGKTRSIEILKSELTAKDVHAFIAKWMSSTETVTSCVKITREDEEEWSVAQVLKGIRSERFNRDSRDRHYITSRNASGLPQKLHDMGHGLDIMRDDGLMATVAADGPILSFCVWHRRSEIKDLVSEYTQNSLDAQDRAAQLEEASDAMQQRILENVGRIEATTKRIEEMEQRNEKNLPLDYILKSLRADIAELEVENQKIQLELQETAVQITEAKEQDFKIIQALAEVFILMYSL